MLKASSTNSIILEVICQPEPILTRQKFLPLTSSSLILIILILIDLFWFQKLNHRIYVAPLKDLNIPQKLSNCSVECEDCVEFIDSIFMIEHPKNWSGEKYK